MEGLIAGGDHIEARQRRGGLAFEFLTQAPDAFLFKVYHSVDAAFWQSSKLSKARQRAGAVYAAPAAS